VPYNTLRYSTGVTPFAYSFQLTPGQYSVTMKFVEPRAVQTAGQRVFGVAINGAAVVTGLDLFNSAGSLKASDSTFPVLSGDGKISIVFTASSGNAVVSGIQIDGPPQPKVPMYLSGPEASLPAACPGPGLTFFDATDTDHLFRCFPPDPWHSMGDAPKPTVVCSAPPVGGVGVDPRGNRVTMAPWTVDTPLAEAQVCYSYPHIVAGKYDGTTESQCHLPGDTSGQCWLQ
jgi:hypothetical protein